MKKTVLKLAIIIQYLRARLTSKWEIGAIGVTAGALLVTSWLLNIKKCLKIIIFLIKKLITNRMLTLYEFLLMSMPSSMSFYSFDQLCAPYSQNWWQFIWIGIDSTRLPRDICSDRVVDQQTILYQGQVGKTK